MDNFPNGAVFRADEANDAMVHRGAPEPGSELILSSFVGVVKAMKHYPQGSLPVGVIVALAGAEFPRRHIPLTIAGAKEDVLAAAALQHPHCDLIMLVLISVLLQFGAVFVPFKMRAHL